MFERLPEPSPMFEVKLRNYLVSLIRVLRSIFVELEQRLSLKQNYNEFSRHGSWWFKANTTPTTFSVSGERAIPLGTVTYATHLNDFEAHPTSKGLKYIGTQPLLTQIIFTGSVLGGNNRVAGLYIGICPGNVTPDPDTHRISESEIYITLSGETRGEAGALQHLTILNPGDTVFPILQNRDAFDDMTLTFMKMVCFGVVGR